MPEWIALSPSRQAHQGYLPRDAYHHTAAHMVAPVFLAELPRLLPHYVLGFVALKGGYQPVAVLGLTPGRHLYLADDGRWLTHYVPVSQRGYPFALAATPEGRQVFSLKAEHLTGEGGWPLFGEDGRLAEPVQATLDFLTRCERDREVTAKATAVLHEVGVLHPWSLVVNPEDGDDPIRVKGLYRVDEAALNGLEAEGYIRLRGGPMALAHAQLFSMGQLQRLTELSAFHDRLATSGECQGLDGLLDGIGDDEVTFDFDR